MKKILYIASIINNRGGGASKSPINLINSLINLDYDVHLLSNSPYTDISCNKNNKLKYTRIKYSLIGKKIDTRRDKYIIKILKMLKYIMTNFIIRYNYINVKNYDLMITDSLHSHYAKKKSKLKHNKSYLIFRISPEFYFNYNNLSDKKTLKNIFLDYNKIIFPSKNVQEEWNKIFPELKNNFTYLFNYIDEVNVNYENENDNCLKIGCIGNLVYSKGQDIALNAFVEIAKSYNTISFYFAGKALEVFGQKIINKITVYNNKEFNISYLGYCNNVLDALSSTDILIVPSRTDMFPRVVLEGLYTGTIVVASSVGGNKDMIIDGYNGFLFDINNENELIRIINDIILMSKQERKTIKENAINYYYKMFSQKRQQEKLKQIL